MLSEFKDILDEYERREKDQNKLAYFAGLFDGEGHVDISNTGRFYSPAVKIEMLDKNTIKSLKEYYGGSFMSRKRRGKWFFIWSFTGSKQVRKFCDDVRPYSITKLNELSLIYRFCDMLSNKRGYRLSEKELKWREDYKKGIQLLRKWQKNYQYATN